MTDGCAFAMERFSKHFAVLQVKLMTIAQQDRLYVELRLRWFVALPFSLKQPLLSVFLPSNKLLRMVGYFKEDFMGKPTT